MTNEFIEYPKTLHFKELKSLLFKNNENKVLFHGTVKLHGTNFSIVIDNKSNNYYYFQSRNKILEDDTNFYNYQEVFGVGNALITFKLKLFIDSFVSNLKLNKDVRKIIISGELAGLGVQNGVAISNLSKKLFIFNVRLIGDNIDYFIDYKLLKEAFNNSYGFKNIYCIENFQTWDIEINVMDNIDLVLKTNKLQEITDQVENKCPVADFFGFQGVGEGVVWTSGQYRFKVKGDEHTSSKVRTLKPIDLEKIEKLKTLNEFTNILCTEARLKQGLQYLFENNINENQQKEYVSWIIRDTLNEEKDFILEKGIDVNSLSKNLAKLASLYFQNNYNK